MSSPPSHHREEKRLKVKLEEAQAEHDAKARKLHVALALWAPTALSKALVVECQSAVAGEAKRRLSVKVVHKMKHTYVALMCFAFLGMFCQIVEAELLFDNGNVDTRLIHGFKVVVSATTVPLLWLLYVHYKDKLILGQLKALYHEEDTLASTGLLRNLVMELLMCALHCPPTGSANRFALLALGNFSQYTPDAIASVWICVRAYLVVRWIHTRCGCHDSVIALSLGGYGSVDFTPWHTFKLLLISHGVLVVNVFFWGAAFFHAHALRACERPNEEAWNEYWSAVWNAVTIMTVGYGDVFPETHIGRLVGVSASLTGTVTLALLVTTVTTHTQLTAGERSVMFMVRAQTVLTECCCCLTLLVPQITEGEQKKLHQEEAARLVTATIRTMAARRRMERQAEARGKTRDQGGSTITTAEKSLLQNVRAWRRAGARHNAMRVEKHHHDPHTPIAQTVAENADTLTETQNRVRGLATSMNNRMYRMERLLIQLQPEEDRLAHSAAARTATGSRVSLAGVTRVANV